MGFSPAKTAVHNSLISGLVNLIVQVIAFRCLPRKQGVSLLSKYNEVTTHLVLFGARLSLAGSLRAANRSTLSRLLRGSRVPRSALGDVYLMA